MAGTSFRQGGASLDHLAGLKVSAKQVERIVRRIGQERTDQRDAQVEAFVNLPLLEKTKAPPGVTPPPVAVVMPDGGRLQIRKSQGRQEIPTAATQPPTAANPDPGTTATDQSPAIANVQAVPEGPVPLEVLAAPGSLDLTEADLEEDRPVQVPGSKGKHWREDKIAVLLNMSSPACGADPCPDIPSHFLNAARIDKLARDLKTQTRASDEPTTAEEPTVEAPSAQEKATWDPPKVKQRKVVASRQNWKAFGPMVAQAAWSLGFFAATRRAFVGDGSNHLWGVWQRHFSSFVPILDFIHALSYVYAAAMAGRTYVLGWSVYVRWIRWVWQGEVVRVIEELGQREEELGPVTQQDGATSPRQIVKETRTYLVNHQGQMKYSEYRRQGLPITSSHIESEIKRINQRVKGTEKFWSEEGAEWILQLRADYLSDDKPMEAFWETRQAEETGQRRYRRHR